MCFPLQQLQFYHVAVEECKCFFEWKIFLIPSSSQSQLQPGGCKLVVTRWGLAACRRHRAVAAGVPRRPQLRSVVPCNWKPENEKFLLHVCSKNVCYSKKNKVLAFKPMEMALLVEDYPVIHLRCL